MLLSSLPYHGELFGAKQTPLSRIRLRQRLGLLDPTDAACLAKITSLFDWYRYRMEHTDADLIQRAKALVPTIENEFVRDLILWRLELRTVVAALRRRHRGETAPADDVPWGLGRWVAHLRRHWSEPLFRLERVFPWLGEAKGRLEADDALGLERVLLQTVWDHLERIADGHHFDFEAVVIYALRWDLIARWTRYQPEPATQRFVEMVEAGMAGFALPDPPAGL
jgi:hypothetical protein